MVTAVAIDKQMTATGAAHLCLSMKSASVRMPNPKPNEIRPIKKIGLKSNIIDSPFMWL